MRNGSQRRALIEMLTVMAIIALLIGILTPVCSQARQSAKRAKELAEARASSQPSTRPSVIVPEPPEKGDEESSAIDTGILVALITACLGAIAWLYRSVLRQLSIRGQLGIIEVLSDSRPRTRDELRRAVKSQFWEMRIPDAFSDSLAALFRAKMLVVKNGRYSLWKPPPRKGSDGKK